MPQEPLISFIVTTYNLPKELLLKCLRSIMSLSLTPSEREIVIIDDGSEHSLIDELEELRGQVVYIWNRNQGLSAARNTGLSMVHGQYIQFVDGDDYLLKHQYEHVIELLKKYSPDMVMFSLTHHEEYQSTFHDSDIVTGASYMKNHNLHSSACGYVFRRSSLGDLRFTLNIYHEDEEFTPLLLLCVNTLIKTTAQAYYYRLTPHSITRDSNPAKQKKRLDDTRNILERLTNITDRLPFMDKTSLQRRIAQLTMDYIYQTMVITHDLDQVEERILDLKDLGLFPLPDKNYTSKYAWFRRLSYYKMGRIILFNLLRTQGK
ncbi:MAG: glycosyltransferase [Prevotella sp.]|nr:glycosyltransferase [Prevotella sp.]